MDNARRDGDLKTVSRAGAVMAAFLERDNWGVSALARHLGITKTIVHRLLTTLASTELLAFEPETATYVLGPLTRSLGQRAMAPDDLVRAASTILADVCRVTRETVTLAVIRGFSGLCIESVESPQAMRMTFHRGERFPLNAGAVGKALLAFQNDAFIEAFLASGPLPSFTENTITDPAELRLDIARARARGYADSDGEITPGARSVGVPVWGTGRTVIGAIVLSAPAFRLQGKAVEEAVGLLHASSHRLSQALSRRVIQDDRKQAS